MLVHIPGHWEQRVLQTMDRHRILAYFTFFTIYQTSPNHTLYMLYRFILVKILPSYTQFPAKQLRLMNVEQEVHGATIASPMGSSTLELDSTPPRSPPVKKLKRHSMEEAPQQQTGMTLFISFQSFFWLDAILSSMFYMLVSEIISPYFTQGSTLQEQRYLSWICS